MKFMIERTSCWSGSEPPCEGASVFSRDDEWGETKWTIDVDNLEALMALAGKEGQLIVSAPCPSNNDLPCIEIYDTYRE